MLGVDKTHRGALYLAELAHLVSEVGYGACEVALEVLEEREVVGDTVTIKDLLNFLEVLVGYFLDLFDLVGMSLDMPELALWTPQAEAVLVVEALASLEEYLIVLLNAAVERELEARFIELGCWDEILVE